jgi:hypothetical protein
VSSSDRSATSIDGRRVRDQSAGSSDRSHSRPAGAPATAS